MLEFFPGKLSETNQVAGFRKIYWYHVATCPLGDYVGRLQKM